MTNSCLHIGLVLFNMPLDQTSGSCRHVGDLASALIRQNIKVTIFAGWSRDRKHVNNLKKKGIQIKEIKFRNLESWKNLVNYKNNIFVNQVVSQYIEAIISENNKSPINVLNIQHLIVSPIIGVAIKHFIGVPFVLTCQGSDIYELSSKQYKRMFNLASNCEALICISPNVKKSVLLINEQLKKIKKIVVIPLGVDRKIFCHLNIQRKKQILFVGRLTKEKGVDEAINVFLSATNSDKLSDYKLLIAGSGHLRGYLEKKYSLFIKKNRIVFLGSVSQKELVHLYNNSKLFLFTSIWEEPFGMVLTEALSTGTPIIANNVGYVRKIVSRNTGLVIPKNDWRKFVVVLKRLLSDEKELRKLNRGEIVANRFDWDITVKKIINVYKSVIN